MVRDALHIDAILRCYWDGEATPSVEAPLSVGENIDAALD
jgi:hypothetical protein